MGIVISVASVFVPSIPEKEEEHALGGVDVTLPLTDILVREVK